MSTAAPQLDLEALLSSAEEMDALPTTVARLATLVSDDTFEVEDIVEVVSMDQAFTATWLVCPTSQRRLMSGMLTTRIRACGSPCLSTARASSTCRRKVAAGVMPASVGWQASLAPMRTVT